MTNIIKDFNKITLDLLEQTIDLVGTKYLFNFKTIIQFNAIAPIEKFTETMLPHRNEIINRNVDFFINHSKNINGYNNINNNDIIDLGDIFLKIDKSEQENIWDILYALIILCEDRLKSKNSSK